ncbi:3'-5' exonuclease [Flectobacillus major]|jgi:DNA polymerase-3 subunit epsilon|uniref:3'-5' exonuclease n=1 Tax=Flectobacillus major TaxID=103 RepID=UPI0005C49009|nr:3'-5' exonuclease [Flectobacillus major]
MNFTAIDFETANNYRSSACALGAVRVENGVIVEKKEWLIRPTPFEVGYYQFRVHGLSAELLEEQPTFDVVWHEIKPMLDNTTLVAHNGKFDFSVLQTVMSHYEIPKIPFSTLCSLELSRKVWVGEPGYGLNTLATNKLNHQFNHHNAMEDAEVSALLLLRLAEDLGANTIEELVENFTSNRSNQSKRHKRR